MTAPTKQTRQTVYRRDNYRCVACNASDGLTFQHRRAVGLGGSRITPSVVDGLTLCYLCNAACEADMQSLALGNGWKVRRWADPMLVPCYYPHDHAWFRFEGEKRIEISSVVALDMLHGTYGDQIFDWRAV